MKASIVTFLAAFITLVHAQVIFSNGTFQCLGTSANKDFCAGDSLETNIIIRCTGTVGQPGNCNDNLAGLPPRGVKFNAFCYQSSPTAGDAACSLNGTAYPDSSPPFKIPSSSSSSSSSYSSSSPSTSNSSTPTLNTTTLLTTVAASASSSASAALPSGSPPIKSDLPYLINTPRITTTIPVPAAPAVSINPDAVPSVEAEEPPSTPLSLPLAVLANSTATGAGAGAGAAVSTPTSSSNATIMTSSTSLLPLTTPFSGNAAGGRRMEGSNRVLGAVMAVVVVVVVGVGFGAGAGAGEGGL